jgi:1-acyl-sn-glycerol-3-phosphate acyltransferase
VLFDSPLAEPLRKMGLVLADSEVAHTILDSGATLMVFPGGDYDAVRPTSRLNQIDFRGRTGYIKTALRAGVPIVPMVSIGGHENQLYLSRGEGLAKLLGLKKMTRMSILPLSVGFPFGPSLLFPVNLPLPTKIVTQVLEPVDVRAQFGDDPDLKVVDAHIRKVMQSALDELAKQRRLPIIG